MEIHDFMKESNTVIGSAALVMIVSLSSKLLGFVRQMVIASQFGSTVSTDIFFVSSEFMLGLSGALLASLTSALVTIYIDTAVKKNREEANKIASKMLTIFLIASGAFIILINLFAPYIAGMIAPAYSAEDSAVLVKYLRFFSVVFIFTAFQSIYAAVLNANDSFVPGKLYGIVYNPIAIIFVLVFGSAIGTWSLVIAFILGNIGQTLLLRAICGKVFRFRPSLELRDKAIKHLIILSLPLLAGNVFTQLNGIIDKAICSVLGEGIASNYSYAYTLEQFVTATITISLSIILLSKYASYAANGNTEMVIKTFKDSLGGLILLLAPITIIACVMSYEIVSVVYMRGQFDTEAAKYTSQALVGFCIGFIPVAIREMYVRLHFAYQDTKTPMLANMGAVAINGGLSLILAKYMGIFGISLATSVSVLFSVAVLNKTAKKYIPEFRFLSIYKLLIKTAAAAVCALCAALLVQRIGLNPLLKTCLCVILSGGVYVLALVILRCDELKIFAEAAKNIVLEKFKR